MSNLLEKASILLTPTAYDDGKILSVKPIEGSGDFQFTRNSDATRVNSAGLIESLQTLSSNLVTNGDFSQEGPELVKNGDFLNYFSPPAGGTNLVGGVQFNDWDSAQSLNRGTATLSYSNGGYRKTITTVGGATAGWQQRTKQNIDSDLVVGKTYNFSVVVELSITVSSFRVAIQTGQSGNVQIGGSFGFVANVPQTISGQFTCTSNTSQIIDFFSNTLMTAGQYYEIRDVSLKEAAQDWSVTDSDANNYVVFNGSTARLKFLNTSPLTTLETSFVMTAGKKYKLTVDVLTVTSGGIKVDGAGISETFNVAGITTRIINPTSTTPIRFYRATANVDITLNSVKLIEITDDTNLPRIDYSPYSGAGTCGHWLFENQSTNLIPYSNDLNTASNAAVNGSSTITLNYAASPSGENDAQRLEATSGTANGDYALRGFIETNPLNLDYSHSVWLKSNNGNTQNVIFYGRGVQGSQAVCVVTNQWQRFEFTGNSNTGNYFAYLGVRPEYGSDATIDVLAWGAQVEQQSYATSYIPTSGSTVTRNQEAAFGSGNSSLINSTEGTLYAEIAALANDSADKTISISDGTNNNRIWIGYSTVNERLFALGYSGNVVQFVFYKDLADETAFIRVAVKYKENDFSLFVNGSEISTDNNGLTPIGLNSLNFDIGNGNGNFYGKCKSVAVFKEALTDAELTCLTTI